MPSPRKRLLRQVSRVGLWRRGSPPAAEKRLSAVESCRLASTVSVEGGEGWEVQVTRALILTSLGLPEKEGDQARGCCTCSDARRVRSVPVGDLSQDTHRSYMSPDAKIPLRSPLASLQNTLGTMSNDKHTPLPSAPDSLSGASSSSSSPDKGKATRPIITPASLSRRTAPTARSFSSLQPPKIPTFESTPVQSGSTPPSLLAPPRLAVIAPTPEASPVTPSRRVHHKSVPETPSSELRSGVPSAPPIQKSYSTGSGKRKAEEAEVDHGSTTPPKEHKEHRATFAPEPRTHRASASSHAPSSYRRKRARLSLPSDPGSNPPSRPPSRTATIMSSLAESINAKTTGSWSSRKSGNPGSLAERQVQRQSTKATSSSANTHTRSNSQSQTHGNTLYQHQPAAPSRRSLSQASIPLSALISPHAPSVAHSGTFHMRDPRKPAPIQSTPWSLSFPSRMERDTSRWELGGWVERGGSPLHSWFFFLGFVIFPVWWAASFVGVPQTRRLGAGGVEKGVVLDDPQVEHDARSWRTRCRVMAVISLFTYIPFIVLVIVFAR